jgi:hypothetical protein
MTFLKKRIYVENNQRVNHTTQKWKKVFLTLLFVVGLMQYTLNTTMYSFDPGFQIDESYKPGVFISQIVSRFLLGIAVMLIGLFSFRVYIFWPTLIDRHKNNYAFSMVFFSITIYSSLPTYSDLMRYDEHTMADSGQLVIASILFNNLYVIAMQRFFSVSKEGYKGALF